MWTLYDGFVAIALAAWMISSVLAQKPLSRVLQFDLFGLLPNCRFFAPKPVSHDLSIYVRSIDKEGRRAPWQMLIKEKKEPWCVLWNPQHRLKKAIHDILEMLQSHSEDRTIWHLSYPYLLLLNVAAFRLKSAAAIQFVITAHAGYENDNQKLVFLSHVHNSASPKLP